MSHQIPARMQKHCRQSAMRKAFLALELADTELWIRVLCAVEQEFHVDLCFDCL